MIAQWLMMGQEIYHLFFGGEGGHRIFEGFNFDFQRNVFCIGHKSTFLFVAFLAAEKTHENKEQGAG